jgi:hypothetical protein
MLKKLGKNSSHERLSADLSANVGTDIASNTVFHKHANFVSDAVPKPIALPISHKLPSPVSDAVPESISNAASEPISNAIIY